MREETANKRLEVGMGNNWVDWVDWAVLGQWRRKSTLDRMTSDRNVAIILGFVPSLFWLLEIYALYLFGSAIHVMIRGYGRG